MGRQAWTSKESELARSNTISPGNPQGTPNIPRYSTSGFQKAAQQTPVFGSGSWFFREASPENIPNLSKMNQNNIELCKTTGFWWVDRPEPLKNQNWLGPTPSPQEIPREPPIFPGIAPVVFRRQLNKPLCWDLGPDSLEGLPLKISQTYPKWTKIT